MRVLLLIISLSFYFFSTSCSRCSRSGNEKRHQVTTKKDYPKQTRYNSNDKNMVSMVKQSGVYHVPVRINGVEMSFVFDTGASDVTISLTEALYLLKNNKLYKDDIKGEAKYMIADGSIADGTIINLRTVQIGNKKLKNVKASVVHNLDAPLLLGQSALEEFGEFSVNYKKGVIIFK